MLLLTEQIDQSVDLTLFLHVRNRAFLADLRCLVLGQIELIEQWGDVGHGVFFDPVHMRLSVEYLVESLLLDGVCLPENFVLGEKLRRCGEELIVGVPELRTDKVLLLYS